MLHASSWVGCPSCLLRVKLNSFMPVATTHAPARGAVAGSCCCMWTLQWLLAIKCQRLHKWCSTSPSPHLHQACVLARWHLKDEQHADAAMLCATIFLLAFLKLLCNFWFAMSPTACAPCFFLPFLLLWWFESCSKHCPLMGQRIYL